MRGDRRMKVQLREVLRIETARSCHPEQLSRSLLRGAGTVLNLPASSHRARRFEVYAPNTLLEGQTLEANFALLI